MVSGGAWMGGCDDESIGRCDMNALAYIKAIIAALEAEA